MPRLKNPANDAADLAASLKGLGLKVTLLMNANRKAMNQAIVAFREALAADRQSEGVFFFAGHGVQAKGVNYLIPVGADIQAEVDLEDEAVSAQKVLGSLEEARNRVNLVILDACRDNPLPSTLRSSARGLAVVTTAPPETLILYSTAAGQTASDGDGRNSPFAQALLAHIADAGDVTQTVKVITGEVKKATGGQQTPYVYMGLSVDFMLNAAIRGADASPSQAAVQQPTIKLRIEKTFGSVAIETAMTGTLFVDGELQGTIPVGEKATLENVKTGSHSLLMKYDDGTEETKSLVLRNGEAASVVFSHAVASSSAQSQPTSAPASALESPQSAPQAGALASGAALPVASIKIDGNFDDWRGVVPAFAFGTASPAEKNLEIDKVSLAVDAKNLYLRFDIKDVAPSSFFHPNNFNTKHLSNYAIHLSSGPREVEAHVALTQNQWKVEIFKKVSGGGWVFVPATNSYSMKGSSFEASFQLEQIRKALRDHTELAGYWVNAYVVYPDDKRRYWTPCDSTLTKEFLF